MTDPTRRPDAEPSENRPPVLEVIGDVADAPTEYTFVPRTADDAERATTWITADADAVADLDRWE